MRHVVIGAAGFTGGHLVRELREAGEQVVACDMAEIAVPDVEAVRLDITDAGSLEALALGPDDVVYHLAARQYHLPVPSEGRTAFFEDVNTAGTQNLLRHMQKGEARRLVFFSTDMVYGLPQSVPVRPDHPQRPLGPYGGSKAKAEAICRDFRAEGMSITILRPRLIVGPGRYGVLTKLFRLIRSGLPVPMIGSGMNRYQMISVFDCVSAARAAVDSGLPNAAFNLGSGNPPMVRDLLRNLIREAGSRSILVPTPGRAVKGVLAMLERSGSPLMYREQYSIADIDCIVDIEATREELGWEPAHSDANMLVQAYSEFTGSPAGR
jgi:dTDP-glucose 4,6-dehydratase